LGAKSTLTYPADGFPSGGGVFDDEDLVSAALESADLEVVFVKDLDSCFPTFLSSSKPI